MKDKVRVLEGRLDELLKRVCVLERNDEERGSSSRTRVVKIGGGKAALGGFQGPNWEERENKRRTQEEGFAGGYTQLLEREQRKSGDEKWTA